LLHARGFHCGLHANYRHAATTNGSCGASWNWLYNGFADEGEPELNCFKLRAM
jgi:hypothetical protein